VGCSNTNDCAVKIKEADYTSNDDGENNTIETGCSCNNNGVYKVKTQAVQVQMELQTKVKERDI
jgi:hypothetical protein